MHFNFCFLARRTTPLLEYIKTRKLEKQVGDVLPGEYLSCACCFSPYNLHLYLAKPSENSRRKTRRAEEEGAGKEAFPGRREKEKAGRGEVEKEGGGEADENREGGED